MDEYFFSPSTTTLSESSSSSTKSLFQQSPFTTRREDSILDVPAERDDAPRGRESKRKRIDREQREEEEKEKAGLVVVGYESKMFRDPETAANVNAGKYLVPWMGDKSLMIDRYDVRLLLDDRKLFKKEKEKGKVKVGGGRRISKEEAEEEALCDYERYYDLEHYEDDVEKEEEQKRAKMANEGSYHMVSFSYSHSTDGDAESTRDSSASADEDKTGRGVIKPASTATTPHTNSDIHKPDMAGKQQQVITHTAKFVAQNGPAVELALLRKQASNPDFDFLTPDHPLHSYYQALVRAEQSANSTNKPAKDLNSSGATTTTTVLTRKKAGESTSPSTIEAHSTTIPTHTEQPVAAPKPASPPRVDSTIRSPTSPSFVSAPTSVSSPTKHSASSPNIHTPATPPADVREVIDKLTVWVAKNGVKFEQKVKEKESKNEKFGFLYPWNPHNAYYKHALDKALASIKLTSRQEAADLQTTSIPSTPQSTSSTPASTSPSQPEIVQPITEFPIIPQLHLAQQTPQQLSSTTATVSVSKVQLKEDRRNKAKMFLQLQHTTSLTPTPNTLLPSLTPTSTTPTTPITTTAANLVLPAPTSSNSTGSSRERGRSRSRSRSRGKYKSRRGSRSSSESSSDSSSSRSRSHSRHRSRDQRRYRDTSEDKSRKRHKDTRKSKRSKSRSKSRNRNSKNCKK